MAGVDRTKVQRSDDRVVDDAQLALQKLTDQLNNGALAVASLQYFSIVNSQIAWVGAGNVLVQTLWTAPEKCLLKSAKWVSTLTLNADATNFRTFTLNLFRAGAQVSQLASKGTDVAGFAAAVPYAFDLAAQSSDITLQIDDSILLILDGGGTKPALNNGTITLYFQKQN